MHLPFDRPTRHRSVTLLLTLAFVAIIALAAGAATQPRSDNPHGEFKEPCQLCHTAGGWKKLKISRKFDHGKYGFPLSGAHATANCMGCHESLEFAQSKTLCASCHEDSHRGEMGTDCARCHGARSFHDRAPMIRAHQLSRFPLSGSHATVDCETCHKPVAQGQLQFVGTSTDCYSCHREQYDLAPDHKSGGRPTQCQGCHSTIDWHSLTNNFDHGAVGFPLIGSHSTSVRQCDDCHHGSYANMSQDCATCHTTSSPGYNSPGPGSPAHNATHFPASQCATCHATAAATFASWQGGTYTHTEMQLTNGHAGQQCEDCHKGNYSTIALNCYSCHQNSTPGYANATAPTHTPTQFPTSNAACLGCHNTVAWRPASFTHPASFPLSNAHAAPQCEDCHGGNYTSLVNNCFTCHQNSTPGYATATAPTHTPTQFPTSNAACLGCHNTVAWRPATFTHPGSFPLSNAHATPQCEDCHGGNYTSLVNSCYTCHRTSNPGYDNVAEPPHTPTNFPTDNASCLGCHNTVVFAPSTFPANHSTTSFAASYNGAHPAQPCTACHNSGTWNVLGTGNDCYSCHSTDYATATPPHDPTNYPQQGCACHNTTTWTGATAFDHNSVGFPLTGNHSLAARDCADCHSIIGYTANPSDLDCYTCHATDYNTPVVKHTSPNFPTTTTQCITCHSAANANHVTWQGGMFSNHAGVTTGLALTGNHGGFECNDCHTAAGTDLKEYTCAVSCHTSSEFRGHEDRTCAGTTFNTAKQLETIKACYSCHPRGTKSSPC